MANFRKQILLAKTETTYNTDPTPTGAANAIQTGTIEVVPLAAEYVERENVREFFGRRQQLVTTKAATATFSVELAGSGTAGTAPGFAPLLRACAMNETIISSGTAAGASYKPKTDSLESVTLYFYLDNLLHKLTGARGTVSLDLATNQIPKLNFVFTGNFNALTDSTPPTATLSSFQTPNIVGNDQTSGFSIHGFAGALQELSIDLANEVVNYQNVAKKEIRITNRNPSGGIKLEAPTITAKNLVASVASATLGVLALEHGKIAGNIVTINAPKVQLTEPSYEDNNNIVIFNASLSLATNTGNDELVIKFK